LAEGRSTNRPATLADVTSAKSGSTTDSTGPPAAVTRPSSVHDSRPSGSTLLTSSTPANDQPRPTGGCSPRGLRLATDGKPVGPTTSKRSAAASASVTRGNSQTAPRMVGIGTTVPDDG